MPHIRCWTCVGNGVIQYPGCPLEICEDCNGTGADIEKTKALPDGRIPAPVELTRRSP
jgi:DnaJ-class molecular chaperone